MYLLGKYYLFLVTGILLVLLPFGFKLKKKKKYGSMMLTFIIIFAFLVGAIYYLYKKMYSVYF